MTDERAMREIDPVALASALIAADSVTPARGEVFDVLAQVLAVAGFEIDRFVVGEEPDGPVENMIALRTGTGPHLAFAGHLDVVPPGEGWTSGAFEPAICGDLLHGRGAVDMKGAIAAFAAAAARVEGPTLSLLITGDEEGPGNLWHARDHRPDGRERGLKPGFLCLVGRTDLRPAARRYDQDRTPRVGQHVDRRAGQAGPRRLSASSPTIRFPNWSQRWRRSMPLCSTPAMTGFSHRTSR